MGGSGGLCSQLQIYASLLAVAESNNMDIVFSKKMIEENGLGIRIFDLLNLDNTFSIKEEGFFENLYSSFILDLDSLSKHSHHEREVELS